MNFELISLYWAQYLNTFWFLIDKFLSLSGRAEVPKVPIVTTPMILYRIWVKAAPQTNIEILAPDVNKIFNQTIPKLKVISKTS